MAQSGLLTMVENGVISPSQVEELVCPVILDATHHDAHEEFRTEIPPVCDLILISIKFCLVVVNYVWSYTNLIKRNPNYIKVIEILISILLMLSSDSIGSKL